MNTGMHLTNAGLELLGKALKGQNLHFTRAITGDGLLPKNILPENLTAIISPKQSLEIKSLRTTDKVGTAEIVLEVSNENLTQGYFIREYGIMAKDPDNGREILYSYCNKGELCSYLEAPEGTDFITFTLSLLTVIDTAENITVEISTGNSYVTYPALNARLADFYAAKPETVAGFWVFGPDDKDDRLRMLPLSEVRKLILGE